jgi:hypothetical protein
MSRSARPRAGRGHLAALVGMLLCAFPAPAAGLQLPDGRAYQVVSPADKNGGEVVGDPTHVTPAVDGNAVVFSSLAVFGDEAGTGTAADYASVLGAGGWSTHGITPEVQSVSPGEALNDPTSYMGVFTADLSKGVLLANSSLTNAPNVQLVHNLYRRDDLLSAGPGAYELLSDAVSPVPGDTSTPLVAGASADLGKIVFETQRNLTGDASGSADKLYEWDHGSVRLAGVLPNGQPTIGNCGDTANTVCSAAGQGALGFHYTPHTVSQDGSRVFFTSPVDDFGNGTSESSVYMRDDRGTADTADDVTVLLNASERTPPDTAQAATFLDATPDGAKVYFTSSEALTNDAPTSGLKLYMYSVTPDDQGRHLRVLADDLFGGNGPGGVIGTSTDGTYVYFTSPNQLVPGGDPIPNGGYGIYLWHDDGTPAGALTFVGSVSFLDAGRMDGLATYDLSTDTGRVSPDGLHLVFMATDGSGLAPHYDHGSTCGPFKNTPCTEVYLYDARPGAAQPNPTCVSCNPNASVATSDAGYNLTVGTSALRRTSYLNQPLSTDGSRVFFSSAERLVSEDHNSVRDVYEYDSGTRALRLISSGQDTEDSYFMNATPSGDDVYFITREQLSCHDTDALYDLYDARVPRPGDPAAVPCPSTAVPCSGDVCLPAPISPAGGSTPGSLSFMGPTAFPSGLLATPVFHLVGLTRRQVRHCATTGAVVLGVRASRAGRLRAVARGRTGHRTSRLASAAGTIAHGGTAHLVLRLSRAARSYLHAHRRLRVTIAVTYDQAPGVQRLAVTLVEMQRRTSHRADRGGSR